MNYVLAVEPEEEEKPRLYSSGPRDRIPVDEVVPGQENVHAWLIRWGKWQSSRPSLTGANLASAEGLYTKVGSPPSTAPMASDPMLMAIEIVVVGMLKPYRDTLTLFYVRRYTPHTICRALRPQLRFESWPAWAFSCRATTQRMAFEVGYCL